MKHIGEILSIISMVLLVGSVGTIELGGGDVKTAVVINVLSFIYLIGFVLYSQFNNNYTKEDFDEMEDDLDTWCFGEDYYDR